ncbi:MAG: hypothetical protein LW860_15365 [Xanthomonadaceae bacterium]|nr:hypothetical protein [Xanthomonadaceae bacterium]
MRTHPAFHRSLAALLLALSCAAGARTASPDDVALADYLDQVARRDTLGLGARKLADGHQELPLEGRFQQVALARLGPDGEPVLGCVGSIDEAQRFLGRDLLGGKALPTPPAAPAHDDVASRAARHGLTPMQQRRYETLIEQANRSQGAKAAAFSVTTGAGFNDNTPATPVGGNPGTTRGQQRANLLNRAVGIWGLALDSTVATNVSAQFSPLTCNPGGAVLAAAGPTSAILIVGQGIGGPGGITFPVALANKLLGADQNGATSEITATVNSSVDNGCLGGNVRFYYGYDTNTPNGEINLLVVLLHELGHGLGFLSLVEPDGTYPFDRSDVFSRFQRDQDSGQTWAQMTAAARVASFTNTSDVIWTGANVRIASGFLTAAREPDGSVETFNPPTFQQGSSISHWNGTAGPNLLMEPSINAGQPLDLDLTPQLLRDVGWFRDSNADGNADTITNVAVSAASFTAGQQGTITWTNSPGLAGFVTLELSTDGGVTFPVTIASGVTNTGSRTFTVPNHPTTQARVRVREDDFAEPAGVSATNFTINGNAAPVINAAPALSRQQGSPAGAAVTLATTSDAETPAGSLAVSVVPGGTATGVTVGPITNTNGTITATVAASCTATSGTVRLQSSDGVASASANLQVNVLANAAPTLGYGTVALSQGSGIVVNPATGPSDNGSIAGISVPSLGGFTGSVSINAASGAATLGNAGPTGGHVIFVRATDNCGAITNASIDVTVTAVGNTAPTFTPGAAIARQQGSPAGSALFIGTVGDAQTTATALAMSQVAGGTATGVTISNYSIAANGTVSANPVASCSATSGTVRLQVSDGSLAGSGDLQVNVAADTPPTLAYPAGVSGPVGAARTVNPTNGPADNGSIASTTLVSQGSYTGGVAVGASNGVVSLSNLQPTGIHTITVRATDNCGATRESPLSVTVTGNTPPFFSATLSLPWNVVQGSPARTGVFIARVQDTESSAGSLVVTQVPGGTATGVTATAIANTNGEITASLGASCAATSGSLRFQVSDGELSAAGNVVNVNILANTQPDVAYPTFVSGFLGGNLTITPGVFSDNGSIAATVLASQGSFGGTVSVGASDGVINLGNLRPLGDHGLTIRVTDNCGVEILVPAVVRVNDDLLFRGGFESATP